jgi:phosphoglycerate dehydrogenase-like enzyme
MDSCNPKMKVAMLLNKKMFSRTFAANALEELGQFAQIVNHTTMPEVVDESYILENIPEAEAVITCWGTPKLTKNYLDAAKNLKLIAHAAGTPRAIVSEEDLPEGVRIFTAAPIIAIDVAETVLWGMIDLLKHMQEFDAGMRNGDWFGNLLELKDTTYRLNYRLTVGVVSASFVGRNLIRLLKPFGVKIKLYDPYVSVVEAKKLGVVKVRLEELMSTSDVVSVHTPSLPSTKGLISKPLIHSLKDGAVFINTSRGAVIDQQALENELKTGRIRSYLDVFDEEPLPLESELYKLPNVRLSPHMAGGHTVNGGYERGDYIIQQLFTYHAKSTLMNEVTKDGLKIMA